jgi:hypothetical protein
MYDERLQVTNGASAEKVTNTMPNNGGRTAPAKVVFPISVPLFIFQENIEGQNAVQPQH